MYNASDDKHQFFTGGYAHSDGADIFGSWTVQGITAPAYNSTFTSYVAGTSGPTQTQTLSRRERPRLYLDPTTGSPSVLYNGVCPPSSGNDCYTTAVPIAPANHGK
jgi:hypothetical protein